MKIRLTLPLIVMAAILTTGFNWKKNDLPNILWITSEDNSPLLGCYGDEFATTPNMDKLAAEGFLYTNAYANAPVCAPARNTIITGVHACSNGNEQMRSYYRKSDTIRFYTEYLKEKGYYCTNNSKTDYNTTPADPKKIWDECSRKAHYKNRKKKQPFFAIFNLTTSHESSIHKSIPNDQLRHRPEDVKLPPYHPDTPEMRHDWAQYYDKVEDMDEQVGELLKELDEAGLTENTIVFYYGDHGGVLGRSKRYLYETGTHVPFIIRIPKKYRQYYPASAPGQIVERLISFVDLAPTLLSLTGSEAPGYMQGNAFLGDYQKEEPAYVYLFRDRMDGRYDMTRAIVDRQYRYMRNYNPNRIYMQHLEYLWRAPSMPSWEQAYLDGKCNEIQARFWNTKPVEELYDKLNDPWEVNNLADDPAYADRLQKMRRACLSKGKAIRDAGFIPEADRSIRAGETPIYDYVRNEAFPYTEIMDAAILASSGKPGNVEELTRMLKNKDSAIRYWAAQGLLQLGEKAASSISEVGIAAFDQSWNVSVICAEILYRSGMKAKAGKAFSRVLSCDQIMARTFALNSIDHMNGSKEEFLDDCKLVLGNYEKPGNEYDVRVSRRLLLKWGEEPGDYGISF